MFYTITNNKTKLSKRVPIFRFEREDTNKIIKFYTEHPDFSIELYIDQQTIY